MKLTFNDIMNIKHEWILNASSAARLLCAGVSTDSRTTKAGDLFVAIRGGTFNGHDFLSRAIESGARALVIDSAYASTNESFLRTLLVPSIVVENTVHALGELASQYRKQFKIPTLAVAGSNGKTITKEMIAQILSTKYEVLKTEGNLNNHIGVPLTLFQLEQNYHVAIVEIGTNHFGEIAYLSNILQPTHALITNIAGEHLEFFGNLEGAAKAEGELFDWIQINQNNRGTIFLNKDDVLLKKRKLNVRKIISYGFDSPRVDVKGSKLVVNDLGCASFIVKTKNKKPFPITLNVPGKHNAFNALSATAVGFALRVPVKNIQEALHSFTSPGKRSELLAFGEVRIINDCYNSNPDSARAAIEMLRSIKASGKKIAVLADMLELGEESEQLHEMIGQEISSGGIEYLLTYGPLSHHTHEAATVPYKTHYDQKNILAEYLVELLSPGDVVLVKGSRGMKMEDVVTFLKERFSYTKENGGRAT